MSTTQSYAQLSSGDQQPCGKTAATVPSFAAIQGTQPKGKAALATAIRTRPVAHQSRTRNPKARSSSDDRYNVSGLSAGDRHMRAGGKNIP